MDIIPYDPGSITKRGNDKTLYPMPNVADDSSRLCVRVNIPNIPAHRQAFIGAIYNLTRWYSWGRDEAHSALAIAHVWRDVFDEMMAHFYDGCDDCPPEDHCRDFPTDSGVLSYFPTNPFTEPETIPNQFYNKPPFYIFHGDVITDISVPSANPFDLPYLAETELPRIRINVTGDKLVRIYLLSVIQGGYASIVQDDNILTTNWVDLTRASLLDFQAILQAIQEGLEIGDLSGILYEEVITEVKFTTTGSHHIDIIFWPKINSEVIVGFGGGLRKVEICGNEICDMSFELRANPDDPCLIEQRLTLGGEWLPAFNLGGCVSDNCCDQAPAIFRFTVDGVYERSTDGGATYEPAPDYDPRNTATLLPPIDDKCQAASNVRHHSEDMGDKLSNDGGLWAGISSVIGALLGLLIFLGVIGTAGALTPLLLAFAGAILYTGQSAFIAAMTSDVYNTFQCIVYCHIQDDGSFTDADLSAIIADINAQLTGVAASFLVHIIQTLGSAGMTNMARTNGGDAGDCDDCGCGEACDLDLWTVDYGPVVERNSSHIKCSAVNGGDGFWYIIMHAPTSADCCVLGVDINLLDINHTWIMPCGFDPTDLVLDSAGHAQTIVTTPTAPCVGIKLRSPGDFTVDVFLA